MPRSSLPPLPGSDADADTRRLPCPPPLGDRPASCRASAAFCRFASSFDSSITILFVRLMRWWWWRRDAKQLVGAPGQLSQTVGQHLVDLIGGQQLGEVGEAASRVLAALTFAKRPFTLTKNDPAGVFL